MAKKGNLFLLIKSLSKSEKRYVRLYAGMSGQDSNYLKLFDVIDAQHEYDEAAVRKKLNGERFLAQLHVTKIYLTALIMKALTNYHAETSVHSKLLNLLKEIEILFERELYDLCFYKIEKAQNLALKHEKLALLMEIYAWRKKLLTVASNGRNDWLTLLAAEKETLEQMEVLNAHWDHLTNIGKHLHDDGFLDKLQQTGRKATVLQSQVLHSHLLYSIHFMKGDRDQAELHLSDLITLIDKNPERITDDPHAYVAALGNKIGLCLADQRWDEVPALIDKIRAVPVVYKLKNDSKFTLRLRLRTFNLELEMYRDSMQLDKCLSVMPEILRFIEENPRAIPADYRLMFYYQFANIYFLRKDYSQSLRWLNEIMNTNFGDTRIDIQAYARMLNLMVHFELNNIIVMRYAIDNCRRFLKKNRVEISSSKKLLNLFSKISHAYPSAYQTIFQRAYSEIFPSDAPQTQDYIDIKQWLADKGSKTTLNHSMWKR